VFGGHSRTPLKIEKKERKKEIKRLYFLIFLWETEAMPHARKTWLMIYGASSPSITSDMLLAAGFAVKECYTLTQRDFKYTLLRFSSKVYLSQIVSFGKENGIIEQCIPGFDSIEYNRGHGSVDFDGHPGFSLIVENLNTRSSALDIWMDEGDCYADGMLWNKIECVDYSRMRKTSLVSIIKETNYKFKDLEERYKALEQQYGPMGTNLMGAASAKGGSASTHTILMRYRKNGKMRDVMKQTTKLEKQLNSGSSADYSGEIYAAWNPLMPDLYKLGFSFRDAETRVKELRSAGVLEPFTLVRHAKVQEARYDNDLRCECFVWLV
jgi:hypothetical protein